METIQGKEVQKLKLNVTNINSFLKKSSKDYTKVKKNNKRLVSDQVKRKKTKDKEKTVEKKSVGGSALSNVTDVAKSSIGIFDKIFNFGALLLSGILLNALPSIKKKIEGFAEENKEVIDNVVSVVTAVKDFAVNLFDSFTGEYSKEGSLDWLGKFDDSGKLQSGALKGIEQSFNGMGEMLNTIDKVMGGKGTLGNALITEDKVPNESRSGAGASTGGSSSRTGIKDRSRDRYTSYDSSSSGGGVGGGFDESSLKVAMDKAGYTDPTERAMFLAQMAHESGNFRYDEEIHDGSNYEGRSDLGNTQAGDGKRYKGRGYIQLTGRANYTHYGKKLGVDLVNNPELAKRPDIAADVAVAYWNERVDRAAAASGDVRTVTRNINGGYNGLADRKSKFKKYMNNINSSRSQAFGPIQREGPRNEPKSLYAPSTKTKNNKNSLLSSLTSAKEDNDTNFLLIIEPVMI